jgi:CYTH domain-containing protein
MEIERKWLVKNLPNLENLPAIKYERHFLFVGEKIEIRIQKKGEAYEFERKVELNELSRESQKFKITKEEFDVLKVFCTKSLIRESYLLQNNPEISIKIYKEDYEGLIRAEVEFDNENDAREFKPLDWFGEEITENPLGRDKLLISLSKEDFKKMLVLYK